MLAYLVNAREADRLNAARLLKALNPKFRNPRLKRLDRLKQFSMIRSEEDQAQFEQMHSLTELHALSGLDAEPTFEPSATEGEHEESPSLMGESLVPSQPDGAANSLQPTCIEGAPLSASNSMTTMTVAVADAVAFGDISTMNSEGKSKPSADVELGQQHGSEVSLEPGCMATPSSDCCALGEINGVDDENDAAGIATSSPSESNLSPATSPLQARRQVNGARGTSSLPADFFRSSVSTDRATTTPATLLGEVTLEWSFDGSKLTSHVSKLPECKWVGHAHTHVRAHVHAYAHTHAHCRPQVPRTARAPRSKRRMWHGHE